MKQNTQIQSGQATGNFGQAGGGAQTQLLEQIPESAYEPLGPTGGIQSDETSPIEELDTRPFLDELVLDGGS